MDSTIIVALISLGGIIFTTIFSAITQNRSVKQTKKIVENVKQSENQKHIEDGVQCLLRAEIIRAHDKYTDRGFCPIYARENLTRAYNAYKALGGNDVATDLYHKVMELPDKEENENEN